MLASGKAKNDEGVKLHKESIEEIKLEQEDLLKKIKKRENKLKQLEIDLVGLPEKEIKEYKQKAKFKTKE